VIERANVLSGLTPEFVVDSYVPSDATSLYLKGVPVLHAHTGTHEDYSTPRDTADKINYTGLAKTTTLMQGIAEQLIASKREPDYIKQARPHSQGARRRASVYLGTIPDYVAKELSGVRLSGVIKGGPADRAGLKAGDTITAIDEFAIENIYDYVRVLNMLKIGQPVTVSLLREGMWRKIQLTPAPKE
jgi:S1-C subfamily serine protease